MDICKRHLPLEQWRPSMTSKSLKAMLSPNNNNNNHHHNHSNNNTNNNVATNTIDTCVIINAPHLECAYVWWSEHFPLCQRMRLHCVLTALGMVGCQSVLTMLSFVWKHISRTQQKCGHMSFSESLWVNAEHQVLSVACSDRIHARDKAHLLICLAIEMQKGASTCYKDTYT